jgi:hypothetical protein
MAKLASLVANWVVVTVVGVVVELESEPVDIAVAAEDGSSFEMIVDVVAHLVEVDVLCYTDHPCWVSLRYFRLS